MESRENSVLFSLRELRQIETERISEEEEAKQRVEQERIRAREDEERRRREAEEARIRAQQEEEYRRREEEERIRREEQFRLQETEARARAEHQARLEEQRLAQEMALREKEIAKKRPTWLIALAALLLIAAAGLGVLFYQRGQEAENAAKRAALENRQLQEQLAALEKEINDTQGALDTAKTQLANAKDATAQAAAQAEIDKAEAKLKKLRETRKSRGSGGGSSKPQGDGTIKIDNANDPL